MIRFCLVVALCLVYSGSAWALTNQLADHPSPYLKMHAQDPVQWQRWGRVAIERARREDKLLFISSGYFACHWCHVMQRESYQNKAIAELLNKAFVPIKIDRELEPVLDAQLLEFVRATQGYGGWPLNVFLTPEGHPLLGVLYLSPKQFQELLSKLELRWRAQRQDLKEMAARATDALMQTQQSKQVPTEHVSVVELEQRFQVQALQAADELAGGFGQEQKFPLAPRLMAMLSLKQNRQDGRLKDFLILTLENMAKGGLRDQLGGGFYRYTMDPNWSVPHFEKMLYDNAQLVPVYLSAAQNFARPDFERVAIHTLDFILQHMRAPDGAFIASLSAVDEQGREGAYYLWDTDELKQILTKEELEIARLAWGFTGVASLDGGYLPMRVTPVHAIVQQSGLSESEVRNRMRSAQRKLMKARTQRDLPRDDKRLTAWNGLALSALAYAAAHGHRRYAMDARRLRDFLANKLWDGNRLQRALDANGWGLGAGNLEDYAYVSHGLLVWATYTNEVSDYNLAAEIAAAAWSKFYSHQGWRMAESSMLPNLPTQIHITDGPTPSSSAILAQVSIQLMDRPALKPHKERIRAYIALITQDLAARPLFYATQVAALSNNEQQ